MVRRRGRGTAAGRQVDGPKTGARHRRGVPRGSSARFGRSPARRHAAAAWDATEQGSRRRRGPGRGHFERRESRSPAPPRKRSNTGPRRWRRPFQTWEYAPNFALRSWAYVAPYALLAKLLAGDGGATRLTFAATRALGLALPCAVAEAALVRGVAARFGAGAGACLLGLLAASAGVFGAAPALVPSAAAMVLAAE